MKRWEQGLFLAEETRERQKVRVAGERLARKVTLELVSGKSPEAPE